MTATTPAGALPRAGGFTLGDMEPSMPTSIRIKRVYEPPSEDDGARVLVDRLWPRGLRKDEAALDVWAKDLAPSPELRKWFGHDPARFEPFRELYREQLADQREEAVEELLEQAAGRRLTLLYAARDPQHNHATVLAEFLRGVARRKRRG